MYKITSFKEAFAETIITLIIFILLLFPGMWFGMFISIIVFCPFYHDICYSGGSGDDHYLIYFFLLGIVLLNSFSAIYRVKRKKRD